MLAQRKTVGVMGNGVMGSAIATRLLECGYPVYVRDRNDPKMAALVDRGAVATSSPSDLTAQVDVIITNAEPSLSTRPITTLPVAKPFG